MKRKFRFASLLLIVMITTNLFSLSVSAYQNRSGSFSKNYSLTGNYATDIVSVAKAQIGKTQSNLGYTEAWCADFVMDCARLTGMPSSVIPYNYSSGAYVPSFYSYLVNNCGASVVSSRQAGDILFYYCSKCGGYKHVAIVLDSTYSAEGNYWINNVSQVAKASSYWDDAGHSTNDYVSRKYVRPKYGSNPTPSNNTWVKTNKTSYNANETVTFTFGYKYSTSVSLGIFKDGKKYAQPDVTGKSSYSRSFSEPGTYTVYVSGWSQSGYEDSPTVTFTVTDGVTDSNTWVKTNKSTYNINETVTFTFGYKYTTSVSLGIDKDGKRYAQPDVTGKSSYSRSFSEKGTYTVYVSGWSKSGYEDSSKVTFTVTDGVTDSPTWIQTDKTYYRIGETVNFTFSYKYTTSVSLGINKDGKRYSQPEVTEKNSYATSFSEEGTYSVYVSGWSQSGYEDSKKVTFTVYNPDAIPSIPFTIVSHGSYSDVRNTALLPQTATVIIAELTDGALTDITSELYTFTANETKSFEHSENARVFVWDTLDNMRPLAIAQ